MKKLFDVAGRIILITGGSAGIGAMIARAYVENGARVYVSSRKAEVCHRLAEELSADGDCRALPCDLGNMDGVAYLREKLAVSENSLDVLINNAGATWGAKLEDYPEAGWDRVVDLNLKSVFFVTQALLPMLRSAVETRGSARVINIASVNGLRPPSLETYAYAASKAGCIMLTRHLAKRLASENILVNAIAPGPFPTRMMAATLAEHGDTIRSENPLGRVGQPEDIAGVAMFLGSQASAYTTGAVIPCDGGAAEL